MKTSQLRSGDVFLVPLDEGSSAVGVVFRTNGRGIVFGHFFHSRFAEEVVSSGKFSLPSVDSILRAKFGDKFLVEGRWPVVGRVRNWRDEKFPLPRFLRIDQAGRYAFISEYDENSFECLREEKVPIDTITQRDLVPDRLLGASVVEAKLLKLHSVESPS